VITDKLNSPVGQVWHGKRVIPAFRKEEGVYFLRTSVEDIDEVIFWEIYNTIREIEASFYGKHIVMQS